MFSGQPENGDGLYPCPNGLWFVSGGELECRLPDKTVTIRAPQRLLKSIFQLCDGHRSKDEIELSLGAKWKRDVVGGFLDHLLEQRVLCDAGNLVAEMARVSWYPGIGARPFDQEEVARELRAGEIRLSAPLPEPGLSGDSAVLGDWLRRRKSVPTFADATLGSHMLERMLWAAYGVTGTRGHGFSRRTVPSAGGFYALVWYVVVLRETDKYPVGLYSVKYARNGGLALEALGQDCSPAWRCLGDPRILSFASFAVFAVASTAVISKKYGNRALEFAALETGHALQNMSLMAQANDAATCLQGALVQREIAMAFGLGRGQYPLAVLVCGAGPSEVEERQSSPRKFDMSRLFYETIESRRSVNQAGPVLWPPGSGADPDVGTGAHEDPRIASLKAEAEAWERAAFATPPEKLIMERASDLADVLDPRNLVAYLPRQYRDKRFPFSPFSPDRCHSWVSVTDISVGSDRWVMAQCMHPVTLLSADEQRQPYTSANTSGMAAWPTLEGAIEKAALEVLERDAFCCAWIRRRAVPKISGTTLPSGLRKRIAGLKDLQWDVEVLDLSAGFAPIWGILARHVGQGAACVSSACAFSLEEGLSKALDEVELQVESILANGRRTISAPEVRSPADHGDFYRRRINFRRADFLVSEAGSINFSDVGEGLPKTWRDAQARLRQEGLAVFAADVTPPGASIKQGRIPLCVAHVVIPGLLPIWFGHNLEPAALPRFDEMVRQTPPSLRRLSAADRIHPLR